MMPKWHFMSSIPLSQSSFQDWLMEFQHALFFSRNKRLIGLNTAFAVHEMVAAGEKIKGYDIRSAMKTILACDLLITIEPKIGDKLSTQQHLRRNTK